MPCTRCAHKFCESWKAPAMNSLHTSAVLIRTNSHWLRQQHQMLVILHTQVPASLLSGEQRRRTELLRSASAHKARCGSSTEVIRTPNHPNPKSGTPLSPPPATGIPAVHTSSSVHTPRTAHVHFSPTLLDTLLLVHVQNSYPIIVFYTLLYCAKIFQSTPEGVHHSHQNSLRKTNCLEPCALQKTP